MPYNIVDTHANGYNLISVADYFTDFDAGAEFQRVLRDHFEYIELSSNIVKSTRQGEGNRVERLYELSFAINPASRFFVYAHPTEQGGRPAGGVSNEARIQWRITTSWNPHLSTLTPA